MPCSPAQLAANRANALRSTGPRTSEGKAASRGNAYKHGLTGDGIALPTEDAAEISRRFDEFADDLKPKSGVARFLVERVALMSVRMERAALQETANLAVKIRHADEAFAEARIAEANHLIDWIESEPATYYRTLLRSPEGLDCLISAILGIRGDLEPDRVSRWDYVHAQKLEAYFGGRPTDIPRSRSSALAEAVYGQFLKLDPSDGGDLDEPERREWARIELAALIDAEVERLETLRSGIDTEAIDHDRAEAGLRASFDAAPAAVLARKYEAAAERAFYRALRELREVESQQDPLEEVSSPLPSMSEPDEPTTSVEPSDRLGSFFPDVSHDDSADLDRSRLEPDSPGAYIGSGTSRKERKSRPDLARAKAVRRDRR